MNVAPAEIVRTLAAGHRPATVHVAWSDTIWQIPSATRGDGTPLLLTRDLGELATALAGDGGLDTAVALRFDDEPPIDDAPNLGRAWVSGWAEPVPPALRRDSAVAFSEINPITDLLDVGNGFGLWQVTVGEVRLEQAGDLIEIDTDEYAVAEPDPWYGMELDLLVDLYDHHPEVMDALTHRMRHVLPEAERVLPLRMNRYGVTVAVDSGESPRRRYFIKHRETITQPCQVLHQLTCCGCTASSTA